ncbi:MAG: HD domain-containing protein, partial [Alphaproteobacteria bacterium]|nr:HD domain-containing protein [Alphaproteobacteria bacterium]
DWAHIAAEHGRHQKSAAARQILESLKRLEAIEVGFAADQLTHSLMAGTLARRAGARDEEVVAALCHDLGKLFSIPNHGAIAAEMLKPYVSEDIYHAVYWHQEFQGRYYFQHLGKDPEGRKRFAGESWYGFAEKLVDEWDAPAFDPDFEVDPLESFEPEVMRVFSNPKAMV